MRFSILLGMFSVFLDKIMYTVRRPRFHYHIGILHIVLKLLLLANNLSLGTIDNQNDTCLQFVQFLII